ncbi:hypothetical protein ColKHC_13138 [Colletotrichum higginsianum]|nr:hypothetical protein ColKHC_13138 [Colletotrichum higginsianum]
MSAAIRSVHSKQSRGTRWEIMMGRQTPPIARARRRLKCWLATGTAAHVPKTAVAPNKTHCKVPEV